MTTTANNEIRRALRSLQSDGYKIRITRDGHVTYKLPSGNGGWREGRYVEEYRIIDGRPVLV